MKKLLICLFLVACAPSKETVSIVKGKDGKNGTNGLCTVSQVENGALLLCSDGTSAFVENGQDGTNGLDGLTGPQGPQGPQGETGDTGQSASVTIESYTLSSSCTVLSNTGLSAKKTGSTRSIYSSTNCHSSSKEFEMGEGDVFFLSSTKLAVYSEDGLKVLNF